ncbi:MAG: hypothetical protein Q9171_006082 [Xanthocarpia ochracea]
MATLEELEARIEELQLNHKKEIEKRDRRDQENEWCLQEEQRLKELEARLEELELRNQETERLLQRTTFDEMLRTCHDSLYEKLQVEDKPKYTIKESITDPRGKPCPRYLRPWEDFPAIQLSVYEAIHTALHPPQRGARDPGARQNAQRTDPLLFTEDFKAPHKLTLVVKQLRTTLDKNITNLKVHGARGVLFKITLESHGYTFVGKGTIGVFVSDSKHEGVVYNRMRSLQGKSIPVYLGNIVLIKRKWYEPNMLWNEELQRLIFIDFERSRLEPRVKKTPTRVLQELSPSKLQNQRSPIKKSIDKPSASLEEGVKKTPAPFTVLDEENMILELPILSPKRMLIDES